MPAWVARLREGLTACWSPEPPDLDLGPHCWHLPTRPRRWGGRGAHWIRAGGTLTYSRTHVQSSCSAFPFPWKTGQRHFSWDLTTVPGPHLVPATGDASCPAAGIPGLPQGPVPRGREREGLVQGPAGGVLGGTGPHAWGVGVPARPLVHLNQVPRQGCQPAQELWFPNAGSDRTPSSCDSSWLILHGTQPEKHFPCRDRPPGPHISRASIAMA